MRCRRRTGRLCAMLNVGGVLQSATYLDERWATCPFAYLRSFDHLFEAALPEALDPLVVNRVLMLGGAGFAYPKQLLLEHPGVALDVVEIDPAMVQIARERFFLDRLEMQLAAEGRADDLRIFVEDGEAFLRRSDGAPYDAIINDVFVGREAVPFFVSDEGIACARARLTPGGLLMANCVVEYTGRRHVPPLLPGGALARSLRQRVRHRRLRRRVRRRRQLPSHSHRRLLPFHRRHPLRGLGAAAR